MRLLPKFALSAVLAAALCLTGAEAGSAATPAKTVTVTGTGVYYRMAPGLNFRISGMLAKGAKLTYVETVNGYSPVNCGNGKTSKYWIGFTFPGKPKAYFDVSACFVTAPR